MRLERRSKHVLPGFGTTMTFTLVYLLVMVLVPLVGLVVKAAATGWPKFLELATSPRVVASLRLSFGASLLAASVNVLFGLGIAWTLVRYRFPGKRVLDALVDVPFALPTAVAGIALTTLYSSKGWLGSWLTSL